MRTASIQIHFSSRFQRPSRVLFPFASPTLPRLHLPRIVMAYVFALQQPLKFGPFAFLSPLAFERVHRWLAADRDNNQRNTNIFPLEKRRTR